MTKPEFGKFGKLDCCVLRGGPSPGDLRIFTPGGEEVKGVTSVELPRVVSNSPIRIKIEMLVGVEVLADPLFDIDFIRAAAKVHGYRLVMVPNNGGS